MASNDLELGLSVQQYLLDKGVETPMRDDVIVSNQPEIVQKKNMELIEAHYKGIMEVLGLDITDDSLQNTPHRVAKMYMHDYFYGLDYSNFPACSVFENKYTYTGTICIDDIQVYSVCEHHIVPFVGTCKIMYKPSDTGVMGLSKFNRVVDFFGRRPQVQERLTLQTFYALAHILKTDDICVYIEAKHFCVCSRGVKDQNSYTRTLKAGGVFNTTEIEMQFLGGKSNGMVL